MSVFSLATTVDLFALRALVRPPLNVRISISTDVDPWLFVNTGTIIARAEHLIGLYDEAGIGRRRVVIKVASTWEGIRAAERLERQGIHCNLSLMFNLTQAVASAQAGATLISPFVGRIMDWYRKAEAHDVYAPEEDRGIHSVTRIYNYYNCHGYPTVIGLQGRTKLTD